MLFTSGNLVQASVPINLAYRAPPAARQWPTEDIDIFGASVLDETYTVRANAVRPSVEELKLASEEYSLWVIDRYLDVPDTLPARVLTLTHSIVFDEQTSYEKAIAIQSYLRDYEYSLDLEEPPASRDVVDYFLFE